MTVSWRDLFLQSFAANSKGFLLANSTFTFLGNGCVQIYVWPPVKLLTIWLCENLVDQIQSKRKVCSAHIHTHTPLSQNIFRFADSQLKLQMTASANNPLRRQHTTVSANPDKNSNSYKVHCFKIPDRTQHKKHVWTPLSHRFCYDSAVDWCIIFSCVFKRKHL